MELELWNKQYSTKQLDWYELEQLLKGTAFKLDSVVTSAKNPLREPDPWRRSIECTVDLPAAGQ